MKANDADTSTPADGPRKRYVPVVVCLMVLLALGIGAYADSFGNKALFHHVPDVFGTPILDDTLFRSSELLPKIFSKELLQTTYGEYRPLGYALFAVINRVMPRDACWPWHVVMLGIHFLAAAAVLLLLRLLVRDVIAVALAGLYMLHPLFTPILNDVNVIYFAWGMLFSVLTLWLYLVYLEKDDALCLLLSILCFAAATFTFGHAVLIPAFLLLLALFHRNSPRCAVAMLVYLTLAACLGGIARVPIGLTLGGLALLVVIVGVGIGSRKKDYLQVVKTLPPYLLILGLFHLAIAPGVKPSPLVQFVLRGLHQSDLDRPLQLWFVGRQMLSSFPVVLGIIAAALMPLAFLLKRTARYVVLVIFLGLLFLATAYGNLNYRDDVTYWGNLSKDCLDQPAMRLNLVAAYLRQAPSQKAGRRVQYLEKARDHLLYLKHEARARGLVGYVVDAELGRAYAGLGNDKVAGYHFLFTEKFAWGLKVMNNRLDATAEFCMRAGFISEAEHHWSCGLVLKPYDVRLYNNLGLALIRKNFLRGGMKYLRRGLLFEPDNPTALCYLAFAARELGDERAYNKYLSRWQSVTGGDIGPHFKRLKDAFTFDRARMMEWFSPEPMNLFQQIAWNYDEKLVETPYAMKFRGKRYEFSEVPLEIGKYFMRRGKYAEARPHLELSYKLNPDSEETDRLLKETRERSNRPDAAGRFGSRLGDDVE